MMSNVPMNRTRALIICIRPKDYVPACLREAAQYLLDRRDTTEKEQRLATETIEWLRSKREEAISQKETMSSHEDIATSDRQQAPGKQRRGRRHAAP